MIQIIDGGSGKDAASIPLATKKGTWIRNQRRAEIAPAALAASKELFGRKFQGAKLRSLTATYNCVGLAFASRRTWVDPEELSLILKEDAYHKVSDNKDVMPGDIVLYRDRNGEIVHVGVILSKSPNLSLGDFTFEVLSKWGANGEYQHDLHDVPELLGEAKEFFSERRRIL